MRRPESWASLGAVLARVLALPPPAWVSESTRHAAGVLLRRLRRDVERVLSREGVEGASEPLGVDRATLYRARGAGGWLSSESDTPK